MARRARWSPGGYTSASSSVDRQWRRRSAKDGAVVRMGWLDRLEHSPYNWCHRSLLHYFDIGAGEGTKAGAAPTRAPLNDTEMHIIYINP